MITIFRAQLSDVADMHSIQMHAFEEEGRRLGMLNIPPLQEQIVSIAEHVQTQIALVAKENGNAVGCVRGVLDGRVCTIRSLVVHPSKHGRGFGSALLNALEAELKDIDRVDLKTNPIMEGNVPFYERHGYRIVEHRLFRPGVTLVHMSKSAGGAA